jgi:enoyl-CoA hydratase
VDYTQISYGKLGRVGRVTMNRPEYRNAIGRILVEEMDDAFAAAVRDDEVVVIMLAAAGPHFSAGHDLGTPAKLADDEARPYPEGPRGTFQRSWELYIEAGLRWRMLPKPTVAAVQGYCIWGGWQLVTTMDVIFASDDAQFLGSDGQYSSLPYDVGIRKAKELLFESRFITAYEALALGFVNRVLPKDDLQAETLAYCERVAERDPFALRLAKEHANLAQDLQGYSSYIISAHSRPGAGSGSQGFSLPSGQRRIAPVDAAKRNAELARGVWAPGAKLPY